VTSPAGSSDAVAVEFELSRAEYLQATRLAMSRQPTALLLPVIGLGCLVAGVLGDAPAYFVGAVVLLAGSIWLWLGAARQRWRKDPAQAGPFTYRLDGSGIAITSPAGKAALPWTRVRKVTTGKRFIVIRVGGSGVVLPRRAIAPADRQRLGTLLQKHSSAAAAPS
jgi:hypothetical protein